MRSGLCENLDYSVHEALVFRLGARVINSTRGCPPHIYNLSSRHASLRNIQYHDRDALLIGRLLLFNSFVSSVTRVDPVAVHVDRLTEWSDVARVLLSAYRALYKTFLSQVIHLGDHRFLVVTKRAGERGVNLGRHFLRGRLA